MKKVVFCLFLGFIGAFAKSASSDQREGAPLYILIGGNQAADASQVTLERNIIQFQKLIQKQFERNKGTLEVYFGNGTSGQFDIVESIPNYTTQQRVLDFTLNPNVAPGKFTRINKIENLKGPISDKTILGSLKKLDQLNASALRFYYAGHGEYENDLDHCTLVYTDEKFLTVQEFTKTLDRLNPNKPIQFVFTQCHSGGFTMINFTAAEKTKPLSKANRCALCSTGPDEVSTGCSPNPGDKEEYSVYFHRAVSTYDKSYDYDKNGEITSYEAHYYALMNADTVDRPVTTSSELLRQLNYDWKKEYLLPVYDYKLDAAEKLALETLSKKVKLDLATSEDPFNLLVDITKKTISEIEEKEKQLDELSNITNERYNSILSDAATRFSFLNHLLDLAEQDPPVTVTVSENNKRRLNRYLRRHTDYPPLIDLLEKTQQQNDEIVQLKIKKALHMRILYLLETKILELALYEAGNQEHIQKYEALLACEKQAFLVTN